MMRGNLRRAYFKQVFEENLHYYLLNQKLCRTEEYEKKYEIGHGMYRSVKKTVRSASEFSKKNKQDINDNLQYGLDFKDDLPNLNNLSMQKAQSH